MALIAWRKLMAGLGDKKDTKDIVTIIKHITQQMLDEVVEEIEQTAGGN